MVQVEGSYLGLVFRWNGQIPGGSECSVQVPGVVCEWARQAGLSGIRTQRATLLTDDPFSVSPKCLTPTL